MVPRLWRAKLSAWIPGRRSLRILGRSARCVQRWEFKEGLPVHRHEHSRRSSIFAYRTELGAWQASREQKRNVRPEKVSTRKNLGFVTMNGKAAKHFRLGGTNWTW
jgi:hypothetical protein